MSDGGYRSNGVTRALSGLGHLRPIHVCRLPGWGVSPIHKPGIGPIVEQASFLDGGDTPTKRGLEMQTTPMTRTKRPWLKWLGIAAGVAIAGYLAVVVAFVAALSHYGI